MTRSLFWSPSLQGRANNEEPKRRSLRRITKHDAIVSLVPPPMALPQNFLTLRMEILSGTRSVGWNLNALDQHGYKKETVASVEPGGYGYLRGGSKVTEIISLDHQISLGDAAAAAAAAPWNFSFAFGKEPFDIYACELTFTNGAGEEARIFQKPWYETWVSPFSIAYAKGSFFSTPPGISDFAAGGGTNTTTASTDAPRDSDGHQLSKNLVIVGNVAVSAILVILVFKFYLRCKEKEAARNARVLRAQILPLQPAATSSRMQPQDSSANDNNAALEASEDHDASQPVTPPRNNDTVASREERRKAFIQNNLLSMPAQSFFGWKSPKESFLPPHRERDQRGVVVACAICLTEYEDEDEVCFAINTNCKHAFHRACMEGWLEQHEGCPCCRQAYLIEDEEDNDDNDDKKVSTVAGFTFFSIVGNN